MNILWDSKHTWICALFSSQNCQTLKKNDQNKSNSYLDNLWTLSDEQVQINKWAIYNLYVFKWSTMIAN